MLPNPTSTGGGVNAFQSNGTNDRAKDDRNVPAPLPVTPCAGLSWLFDSVEIEDHRAARAICETCPMLTACRALLDDVIRTGGRHGQPEGTWAGQLLNPPIPGRETAPCGTERAYQRHRKAGEPYDDACRLAHNEHNRLAWRKGQGAA